MKSYVTTIVGGLIGLALVVAGLWAVFTGGDPNWALIGAGAGAAGLGYGMFSGGKPKIPVIEWRKNGIMLALILPAALMIGGCRSYHYSDPSGREIDIQVFLSNSAIGELRAETKDGDTIELTNLTIEERLSKAVQALAEARLVAP